MKNITITLQAPNVSNKKDIEKWVKYQLQPTGKIRTDNPFYCGKLKLRDIQIQLNK